MTEELEINCLGKRCPRPIIEIAKAARRLPSGSILTVQADDLAFESDVKAWASQAQARILSLERDSGRVFVRIKLAE